MRGDDEQSGHLFSYLSLEQRVLADYLLRVIRDMTDAALATTVVAFDVFYAQDGTLVGAAGAFAARAAVASALFDPQRTVC